MPGSIKVKENNDRIRVNADPEHKEYVVYSRDRPKKWHAHTRPWKDMEIKQGGRTEKIKGLTVQMRNALYEAGKVDLKGTIK